MFRYVSFLCALLASAPVQAEDVRLKVLFLGDRGHHRPIGRAGDIIAPLAKQGIDMAYTEDLADLNSANLARYDALIIYANQTKISPEQEKALLDYVESGKGFVPLHCASYCFLNSPKYISLVGAHAEKGSDPDQNFIQRSQKASGSVPNVIRIRVDVAFSRAETRVFPRFSARTKAGLALTE